MRVVLKSKIHRAWVTDANTEYIGSILIDEDLMDKVDVWNFEKVLVCDVTNGNRFETYAIAGERGSGVCAVQGAAARLSSKGNCLIIMSFEYTVEPVAPKMILVDEENRFVEFLEGAKMSGRFTEQETESYYDSEDAIYRSFWDEDGSVHWGVFDESTGNDFLKACANLNGIMVEMGNIDSSARVLDLGCGNGTTSIWLRTSQDCHVTGVDLSGVRVQNALNAKAGLDQQTQERLEFQKASATELPFEDESFTHLWSQAVIYHVPDKVGALSEAYRVLAKGGIMVFDDLIKPQPNISADGQKYVYDRLLFDTPFSFDSYQQALEDRGFTILEAHDLSAHLKNSYLRLADRTPKASGEHADHYEMLTTAYRETAKAVDNREVGWGLFICQK